MLKSLTHKAYTFASRTSLVTNQSLQKSMLFPSLRRNKKSPRLKKNKTLPTHSPTDKNTITEPLKNQKDMSLDKKEGQLVTKYKNNSRNSSKYKDCSSLQVYRKLKKSSSAIGYYSYTNRYAQGICKIGIVV